MTLVCVFQWQRHFHRDSNWRCIDGQAVAIKSGLRNDMSICCSLLFLDTICWAGCDSVWLFNSRFSQSFSSVCRVFKAIQQLCQSASLSITYTMNFWYAMKAYGNAMPSAMPLNPIILMFVDIDDAKSSSLADNIICTARHGTYTQSTHTKWIVGLNESNEYFVENVQKLNASIFSLENLYLTFYHWALLYQMHQD